MLYIYQHIHFCRHLVISIGDVEIWAAWDGSMDDIQSSWDSWTRTSVLVSFGLYISRYHRSYYHSSFFSFVLTSTTPSNHGLWIGSSQWWVSWIENPDKISRYFPSATQTPPPPPPQKKQLLSSFETVWRIFSVSVWLSNLSTYRPRPACSKKPFESVDGQAVPQGRHSTSGARSCSLPKVSVTDAFQRMRDRVTLQGWIQSTYVFKDYEVCLSEEKCLNPRLGFIRSFFFF